MNTAPEAVSELAQRTRWYIHLRWLLLSAIILPSLASLYLGSGLASQRISSIVISVSLFGTNLAFYLLGKIRRGDTYFRALAMCILAFDVLFIAAFIYLKGGIESRSQLLYALPILMSAALFSRQGVYLTAATAAVSYDFVILANYLGLIHSPEAVTNQATNLSYVLNSMIFFSAALLLVGGLADYITKLLIQKQNEAVRTAKALRRAQEVAKIGSWEWSVADDIITWSEELYGILGVSKDVTRSDYQDYQKFIHPEDKSWTQAIITRTLKTGKPYSLEYRIIRPDKTVRILHTEGKAARNNRGKITKLYGTTQDITAERELDIAKGDFVSLASHQLRTPATSVRMLLALLRDGYAGKLTSEQKTKVEQAFESNERLLKIADDLLNVAKLESGRLVLNKRDIELGSWLKNFMVPQKLVVKERKQKLRLEVPKRPVHLYGDQERLAMVMDNLLSNARKYTPVGGLITVALVPGRKTHKIKVADTGSGMTKHERSQLFGKFMRLDNQASKDAEGTGLGLYLVKNIVDLHGGKVSVASKPGEGTTFTVSLPIHNL